MRKVLQIFLILSIFIIGFYACDRPTEPQDPNKLPNTSMANIPNPADTLFALVTLHWDGEDFDGYIDGYEYRYITKRIFMGDSIVQDWQNTTETSLTIPFLSDDDLNLQTFQVRSIDNLGAVDPSPAEKKFYTVKTIFPESYILYPEDEETYFIIDKPTDWWEGIKLDYVAYDKDGEVVEYAWAVDDGELHWTEDTSVVILPENFKTPLTGEHTIKVVSRDNTNLVDPIW